MAFDVVVFGAGPAGTAAAITLSRLGASVVVVERRLSRAWRIGESLPPAARPLLHTLGVLAEIDCDGHLPSFGNCSAWGTDQLAATDFIFNMNGSGWQLDRAKFDDRLASTALRMGAQLWHGFRLTNARRVAGSWDLRVESSAGDRRLRAGWLIDATGRRSTIARRHNVQRVSSDLLVCVYGLAHLTHADKPQDADARTLIEADPDGWWYSALVPGGRRTVAWLTDADLLRNLAWRDDAWLHARGTRYLASLLHRHGYGFSSRPRCTLANSSRLELSYGDGWLAVGDAAVAFDPLSSQGLLSALNTGFRGASAVADALHGDRAALGSYSEELQVVWKSYLRNLREYYRMEQRWFGRPFWERRHRGRLPEAA